MHDGIAAAGLAEKFRCPVGEHLVCVHVVRGAGAGLVDVHDELIAQAARKDLVCGPNDRTRDRRLEAAQRLVRFGRRLLDQNRRGDQIGGCAQAADREVLDARPVCTP